MTGAPLCLARNAAVRFGAKVGIFSLEMSLLQLAQRLLFSESGVDSSRLRQATFDEANGRLITMVDEVNPQTLQPARTFAFDVFDYIVPMFEGKDPREYEQVSYVQGDEIKYNPLAIGPYVYVVGEISGVQEYGACGSMTGAIEWSGLAGLACGGADIHGWVTGATRVANVELFIDGSTQGVVNFFGPDRIDIPSTTPVQAWRVGVNLDNTTRGAVAFSGKSPVITFDRPPWL